MSFLHTLLALVGPLLQVYLITSANEIKKLSLIPYFLRIRSSKPKMLFEHLLDLVKFVEFTLEIL